VKKSLSSSAAAAALAFNRGHIQDGAELRFRHAGGMLKSSSKPKRM
jgi:hypothetical protein